MCKMEHIIELFLEYLSFDNSRIIDTPFDCRYRMKLSIGTSLLYLLLQGFRKVKKMLPSAYISKYCWHRRKYPKGNSGGTWLDFICHMLIVSSAYVSQVGRADGSVFSGLWKVLHCQQQYFKCHWAPFKGLPADSSGSPQGKAIEQCQVKQNVMHMRWSVLIVAVIQPCFSSVVQY